MVGGQGPTCQSAGPTVAPPDRPSGPTTSPIHGSNSTSLLQRPFNVGLINGQDWRALDPWAHCHTLGSPPTDIGTDLPAKSSHVLTSQPPFGANHCRRIERQWNRGPPDGPWRRPTPKAPHRLPSCLQIPPLPLHALKRGVELGGEVPHSFPSFSKLSSLA